MYHHQRLVCLQYSLNKKHSNQDERKNDVNKIVRKNVRTFYEYSSNDGHSSDEEFKLDNTTVSPKKNVQGVTKKQRTLHVVCEKELKDLKKPISSVVASASDLTTQQCATAVSAPNNIISTTTTSATATMGASLSSTTNTTSTTAVTEKRRHSANDITTSTCASSCSPPAGCHSTSPKSNLLKSMISGLQGVLTGKIIA